VVLLIPPTQTKNTVTLKDLFAFSFFVGIIALIIGWFMNLYTVINSAINGAEVTTLFIVRIMGIFIGPIGGVLGYF